MTPVDVVPTQAVIGRLTRNLAREDHLLRLLSHVASGHQFTNRLDEALVLIPDDVMAEIHHAIGLTPTPTGGTR